MVGASRQPRRNAEIPRVQLVLDHIDPAHEPIHFETQPYFARALNTLGLELRRSELSRGRQSTQLQCRNRFHSARTRGGCIREVCVSPGKQPPRPEASRGSRAQPPKTNRHYPLATAPGTPRGSPDKDPLGTIPQESQNTPGCRTNHTRVHPIIGPWKGTPLRAHPGV